jgi:transcriptional regulator with GAF, ATPase, and Fis domain
VAETDSTVLLTGETGTGKSMIAKLIHQHSPRSDNQFISVHCGAIPETLLESELFGHEKGAFTGAVRRKLGKFEIAQSGTIFLDEIGTITPAIQIKLLHVLQDHIIQRLGSEAGVVHCDVRVLVATNADLKSLCEKGLFRQDLYYRLNVFPIEIPPLSERIEDLPFMIELFIKRLNQKYGKEIREVHPEVLDAFRVYAWPGNIRELENLIERAYILEPSRTLNPKSFPAELFGSARVSEAALDLSCPLDVHRDREIERAERQYLNAQLKQHNGRINDTAKASGMGVRQLHKLLKKHDIRKEAYKISSPDESEL